jgi:hypothetical protein
MLAVGEIQHHKLALPKMPINNPAVALASDQVNGMA